MNRHGNTGRTMAASCVLAVLVLLSGGCQATGESSQDAFARDMTAALDAMESPAGACEICGHASGATGDRKTLSLNGQLIEFCGEACANKFYDNPDWMSYRKR